MEVERKSSKRGFFQLFDWNGKSRKKLFSNDSELSEESKRGKTMENLVKSLPHTTEEDEYTSSNRRSTDFNSASSVTSDEGYGSRAPGVVARLMGLDSLPTLNVSEPSSTPFTGSCALRVSQYERSTLNLWNEYHQSTDCSNISNEFDRLSSNPIELRLQKVQNRPTERFQTEILPPKLAKSIPVTHHKLLSPIRSPAIMPTRNAAYIMEAAANMIDASPQTTSKHKVLSFGSSSVPLKIRDLKDKIEAAHKVCRPQRPDEPSVSVTKHLKGQHKDKSQNKLDYTPTFRITRDSEKGSSNSSRSKGKSVSLAEQARVNVQRKGGSLSSGNGSSANQKERNDAKRKQFSRSKEDMQITVEKGTSANMTNNVLRKNNKKQNCLSNRDNSTSKTSTLDQQCRKAGSVNGTRGLNTNRTINKVTVNSEPQSRKTGSMATGTAKDLPMSRRKNLLRKNQPVNADLSSVETLSDNLSINGSESSIACNVTTDERLNQDAEKMKTSMDVVSFTFTSPFTRSMSDIPSAGRVAEKNSFDCDPSDDNHLLLLKSSAFSSPGFNIIGGDALSVLLEKKLQELTCKIGSSNCNIIVEGTSASLTSSLQNSVPSSGTVTTTSVEHYKRLQVDLDKGISYCSADFDWSSINNQGLDCRRKWQLSEEIEEQNASSSESGIELDHQHPGLLSTLETALTSGSFSDSRNGMKQFLLAQDLEVLSWTPGSELLPEFGIELSESASSKLVGEMGQKLLTRTSSSRDFEGSTNWELDYVKLLLKYSEIMFIEYALGQTEKVMTLNSFNQLEHQNGTEGNREEYNKLEQKLLLDCVSECLELRCGKLFVGSCKGWVKWGKSIQKRGWLAEEVYKEILSWKSMGDIMVDDLVDKDMNTKYGRWHDFDLEAFEEGVEIEKSILTSLVDELVCDLLLRSSLS